MKPVISSRSFIASISTLKMTHPSSYCANARTLCSFFSEFLHANFFSVTRNSIALRRQNQTLVSTMLIEWANGDVGQTIDVIPHSFVPK